MLKSIHLHRAASNNAGEFVDAGSDMMVGDKPDQVANDRAQGLIDSHGAISATQAAKVPAAVTATPRKPWPKAKPRAKTATAPASSTAKPPVDGPAPTAADTSPASDKSDEA